MKTSLAAVLVLVGILSPSARADSGELDHAAKLFEQALAADKAGNAGQRDILLREALKADPEFQLAHWYLGDVYFQGSWQSIESVGQLVSRDQRWQDYRTRLAAADGSPAANAELARWCGKQGLENEAKWHWFKVLQANPENREALGTLKLKRYQGGYYTAEQIAALKSHRAQAERDFKRYRSQFKTLVGSADHPDKQERAEALTKLASVRDAAAIEALMATLVDASQDFRLRELSKDVCQAVIASLSEIKEYQSTLKLVEIALYASHKDVRRRAAEGLRNRKATDYMPQLMASLEAPLESTFSIQVAGNGLVTLAEESYEAGPLSDSRHVAASGFSTHTSLYTTLTKRTNGGRLVDRVQTPAWTVPNIERDLESAKSRASVSQEQVQAENRARQWRNERVAEVLEIATGKELGSDPQSWWTDWQEYNEISVHDDTSAYETYDEYAYEGPDIGPLDPLTQFVPDPPPLPPRAPGGYSCFVAGTPVWTQDGPKPIEQITVGELVLSQDPMSGRLDYRPVLETTARPSKVLVELSIGDEKIITTRGHRFWVTGDGWQMAKFLGTGSTLFGAKGSYPVDEMKELEGDTAYNLAVADYHTYFVGNSRLLVHDFNCPLPTTVTLPGAKE